MNKNYNRVLPRDLFNEAKLLKCIGHLCLQIHDNNNPGNINLQDHDGDPFTVSMWDDGYLQINELFFSINGIGVDFVTQYNSKYKYPLFAYYNYCEYLVFEENGTYTVEFLEFCRNLNK